MESQLVRFLPWDTNHFGHRIGRANIRRLDEASWQLMQDACKQMEIECMYFLVDAGDLSSINELQRQGFIFVDVRLTIERTVPDAPSPRPIEDAIIRPSREDDVETLKAITRDSFSVTRFFADPYLDNEKVSAMYQIWLSKSVTTDFADRVLVLEVNGESVGFASCHLDRHSNEGKIALAALAASARGKGYMPVLILHALEWFRDQGIERVNVPTQGSNIAAQRMYQRCGFVTRSTELWFHKWFRNMP